MIVFLTLLTQIGGIIYLLTLVACKNFSPVKKVVIGMILYFMSTFLFVPLFAKLGNRTHLPFAGKITPYTVLTCLLNRHYVSKKTANSLNSVAERFSVQYPESKILYLDANFPFFDGFPLFPHLSHSDGKKLDLAFFYKYDGTPSRQSASFIGYGHYERPKPLEISYPEICRKKGFWQYGILGKLVPQKKVENYSVDVPRTSTLIRLLNNESATSKIFIEPHLQNRWKLQTLRKIRFHGCHAVRHDDHIHWQIQ